MLHVAWVGGCCLVVSIDHLVFVWCLLVLGCCLVVVWFVYCDCLGFAVCVWLVGYLEVGLLFALLDGCLLHACLSVWMVWIGCGLFCRWWVWWFFVAWLV